MGRKSDYTQEMADKVCDLIIQGQSMRTICKPKTMPNCSTIYKWLNEVPEFSKHYTHARTESTNALFEELLDICDNASNDWMEVNAQGEDRKIWKLNGEHVQRSKLRVDTRKWALSKLQPKKYGERITTEHTGILALSDLSEDELNRRLKELVLEIERSTED